MSAGAALAMALVATWMAMWYAIARGKIYTRWLVSRLADQLRREILHR